jgi:hypothetical protein
MLQFRLRYPPLVARMARGRGMAMGLRAAWLAAAVPLLVAAGGVGGVESPPVAAVAVAYIVVLSAAVALGARRSTGDTGRELDRRFGLDDLLVTAVEVDRRGPSTELDERLLRDAAEAAALLEDRSARVIGGGVRREAETLVASILLVAGLTLLGTGGYEPAAVPRLGDVGLPAGQFGGGGAGGGDAGADGGGGSDGGSSGRDAGAYGDIARELADHAATRGLSRALGQGEPAAAAREARGLAAAPAELSDAGRADLAEALGDAAAAARERDPALADALLDASAAVHETADDDVAEDAAPLEEMEAVAAAIEAAWRTGSAPGAARRTPEAASRAGPPVERLAAMVQEAALPGTVGGGAVTLGAARGSPGVGEAAPSAGAVTRAPPGGRTTGPVDMLDVEWQWRPAVRRYFQRQAEAR